jgi:hypothetical protein
MTSAILHDLLTAFALPGDPHAPWQILPPENAQGFSTTAIWRVTPRGPTPEGAPPGDASGDSEARFWCLRGWPPDEPSAARLAWIQRQILWAAAHCPFILAPLPLRGPGTDGDPYPAKPAADDCREATRGIAGGRRFVERHQRRWQVEPWAAGHNDFHRQPSTSRLAHAMQSLAQLHDVWIDRAAAHRDRVGPPRVDHFGVSYPDRGPSPGLKSRRQQMVEVLPQFPAWLARAEHQLAAARPQLANDYRPWWQLLKTIEHTHRSADPAWQRGLQMAADWPLPLGPVLADPWSDHLFFADDRLVAVIDYGAVRVDSAAADLSRCLSSLCGNQPELRDIALQAYQAVRRLSVEERAAIEVFDQSSRWLAPLHWLRWLFIEQRFPPTPRIRQRLERIVAGQPF